MKKILFISCIGVLMSACQNTPVKKILTPKIGSPNPASQYCVQQGGTLEIRENEHGQAGYCRLPDGTVVEEWKLFRESQNRK